MSLSVVDRRRSLRPTPAQPLIWSATDPGFPQSLREIPHPPAHLWTIGDRSVLDTPCVAIVGTRVMTSYGERVTRRLAAAMSRAGACVISGMARGIDATAHRAVLEAGGRTAAVLPTGADVPYPRGLRGLHADIAHNGLVISEEEPGTPATKGCFHRRNRLIAGLAKLTIVVEAGLKSGANITANDAAVAGRGVAAVPGPIDAPRSQGCNRLIFDGAQIITCVNDALALMHLHQEPEERPALGLAEQKIWDVLAAQGGATTELLVSRTALPLREVLLGITSLELEGLIISDFTGTFRHR